MADGFETVGADAVATSSSLDARPFVGRTHEIGEVTAALADAAAGRGSFFLITGEPGSGKTRLTEEVARLAEGRGFTVSWGRCWEGGGAPAFWPWVQVLRQHVRESDVTAAALAALDGTATPDAATPVARAGPLDPERARFLLFDQVAGVLRTLSGGCPLLLAIDDLQAADPDSALLLRFLAREVSRMRVLLIATYVDAPATADDETAPSMGDLMRDAAHLPLRGLTVDETADLIKRLVLGASPQSEARLDATTQARIFTITEGNPLFVIEAVRLWRAEGRFLDDGGLREDGLKLPTRVRDLFRERIGQLPATDRQLLAAAAVLGRRLDLPVLERMADDAGARANLQTMLDGALRADLLRETRSLPRRFSFSHGLLRETLYHELPLADRRLLHRRAAAAIEHVFHDALGPHLVDIAYHLSRAGEDGASDAIAYTMRAAEQALAVRAYEDAVTLTERSLRLLESAPPTQRGDARQQSVLLLAHGNALHAAGHRQRALEIYQRAARLARDLNDAEILAEAALGCAGGWTGFVEVAKFDQPDREASQALQDLLRTAADALGDRRPALRARLLSRLAVEQIHTASIAERDELTEDAVALARSANSPATLAAVLCDRHLALWVPETLYERLAATQEILGLAETTGDTTLKLMGLAWHVGDTLEAGEDAGIEGKLELFGRLAESYGQPAFVWGYKVHLAMRAMLRGDLDRAKQVAREAFKIGRDATATALVVYGLQMRALWQLRGDDEQLAAAEPALRGAADLFAELPSVRLELAQLCFQLGRVSDAGNEWERIAARSFEDVPHDNNRLFCLVGMGDLCAALGDQDRARLLYGHLFPFGEQTVVSAFTAVSLGSAARCLGVLAHTLGDFTAATSHFELALRRNLALAARPWLARTQYEYADMLAARRGPDDETHAARLASQAAATARALGLLRLTAKAEAFLPQVGGRTDTPSITVSDVTTSDTSPPQATASLSEGVFRQEGDMWTIHFSGHRCTLKDTRGLHYLCELIRHPGTEIHATAIMRATHKLVAGSAARTDDATQISADLGDAGEILDAKAMAQYHQRLSELREELDEAQGYNDLGRVGRARQEIEYLTAELARAGRGQRVASHAERARLTVTKGIKAALQRIQSAHPSLARHLQATIRRGYFCSYTPDPRHPMTWEC